MAERVLITGGSGFLGRNLYQSKVLIGSQVLNVDLECPGWESSDWSHVKGNVSDLGVISKIIVEFEPQIVIHLAANTDIRRSQIDPTLDFTNTLMTTFAVCEATRSIKPPIIIFSSSSAVYGDSRVGPDVNFERYTPISTYGQSKLISEYIIERYFNEGVFDKALIARFPNVVGRFMTHGLIYDLIQKYKTDPKNIEVLGDGQQHKPFILASTLMDQVLATIKLPFSFKVVEYGPSDTASVAHIAEKLVEKLPTKPLLSFGTTHAGWPGDVVTYLIDPKKSYFRAVNENEMSSQEAINFAIDYAVQELL